MTLVRRSSTLIAVVATGALLGACGAATAAPRHPARGAGAQHVTIVGNEALAFSPRTVRVHVGRVRITLVDSGAYPHDLVVPALGVTSPTVTGDPGGTEASITVDFHHPGRYRFFCAYHLAAGMTGTFVVS